METILVVDDEKNYLLVLSMFLEAEGYKILTAGSAEEALTVFGENYIDLLLTDMTMPGLGGMELLKAIKSADSTLPIIMMTAHGTVELAVQAMRKGAFDYITKPFKNENLLRVIHKSLEIGRLSKQNKQLKEALSTRYSFSNIIGKSKPMLKLYHLVEKVAVTKANVLISGESGTGKELVAKAVHYNSNRVNGPFVAVNCSALNENLLESELFGHERGAFTDAKQQRQGRFELAHEGTLFLDEIGEMSPGLQAKILRVLQERSFERVGGQKTITVDTRVLAATNRDLKEEVALGKFREDLYYRLNVVSLVLPPLRARLDDLPLLISHFLAKFVKENKNNKDVAEYTISSEAMKALYAYHWPGNVRELENIIERAVILSSGPTITINDLPAELIKYDATPSTSTKKESGGEIKKTSLEQDWLVELKNTLPEDMSLNETLALLEEGLLRKALDKNDNIQARAADFLGLRSNVFKYKWDKYIDFPEASLLALDLAELAPFGEKLVYILETAEEYLLKDALTVFNGVQAQAAEFLGIKRNLMQYKMKKFKLKN